MSETLESYLNTLNLTSLKAIIRHHNLHTKINMKGKREILIQRLLEHYETETNSSLKGKIVTTPKYDQPTPKRQPPQEEGEKKEKAKKTKNLFDLVLNFKDIQKQIQETKNKPPITNEKENRRARNQIKILRKERNLIKISKKQKKEEDRRN